MKYYQKISFIVLIGLNILFTNFVMAQEPVIEKEYILEKKQRVTRTEFDFSYRVKIINDGDAIKNVSATVSSNSLNTSIIDGNVNFNDVSAGVSSESIDTFTIRQDRRHKFDPSLLVWNIQYELNNDGLPPDPGEEGLLTINGIDADEDGVRDDIQRYIALTYPNSLRTRTALTIISKGLQKALIEEDNKELSLNNATTLMRAGECLYFIRAVEEGADIETALEAEILNTEARTFAFVSFNEKLGGEIFPMVRIDQWKSSCSFDVDALEN